LSAIAVLGAISTSCTSEMVGDDIIAFSDQGKRVNLLVNIPKNGLSTYSTENGSMDENHIDTVFIKLYEDNVFVEMRKFFGSQLITEANNDSIVKISFDVAGLSNGVITAEAYANRMEIVPITGEIALPDASDASTWFMMSGVGALTYSGSSYNGTVRISRDVAKLRILVNKNIVCIPSNLIIDYENIIVEAQQVPDRTQLLAPPPISTPSGLTYINYVSRTGTALRPMTPLVLTNGGQIDSLYLNENCLDNGSYTTTNVTQIKLSIPTQEPGMPVKIAEYTYQLYTNGSYHINRNTIYTLDIKVRGQSLEPLITLDITPWDDVDVVGDINGSTLTTDKSTALLSLANTKDNASKIRYTTDNTSISIDWSEINPAHNIDTSVEYIQGSNGDIEFFWNENGAPDFDFKDTLYIRAGNIIKAVFLEYITPKGNIGDWVGTFHRWNQTGERIIMMRNKGSWTATVIQGARFIVLDNSETTDSGIGTSSAHLGNDAGFDASYPVTGSATTLSGSGLIYFRVGLNSTLANTGAPPRYGVIEIATSEGKKNIYVRQGEEADYVMRSEDLNPSNSNKPRSSAVRFSPFNLTDPDGSLGGGVFSNHNDMPYGELVFDNRKFTEYPSQSGYFFQWNLGGGTEHKAIHPVNTITAISGWPNVIKSSWSQGLEPCPAGYRHPNDSQQSHATSELRQSLNVTTMGIENSLWGFYADGFFDRSAVVSSPNGSDYTTVSCNSSNLASPDNRAVAYGGILVYNPVTKASLFFPAAGSRSNSNGALINSGLIGSYWTSTYNSSNNGWALNMTPSLVNIDGSAHQSSGFSVRCVKVDFGLPGSI